MSEEEIINRINYNMKNAGFNWGKSCIVDNKDLQGLLDLYNKEKEKNKELCEKYCPQNENYISKDKIEEIRDKAEIMDYYFLEDVVKDLNKLLGEEE